MNSSKLGGLLTIWILFLLIGAVLNHFRKDKVNVSRGYLMFVAVMFVLDFVRIFNPDNVLPNERAAVLGQLFAIYATLTLLVWFGSWVFEKRRRGTGLVQPGNYKDLGKLTGWVTAMLVLQCLVTMGAVATGAQEYQILSNYEAGVYLSDDEVVSVGEQIDKQRQKVARMGLFVYFISALLMLNWIYRASGNAWRFGARGQQYSPGWSVATFFVPLLQLWKPFLAMRELWQVSHDPQDWKNVRPAPVLYCWWALCLLAVVFWIGLVELLAQNEDLQLMKFLVLLTLVRDGVYALLAVATLLLVRRIHQAQRRQALVQAWQRDREEPAAVAEVSVNGSNAS